MRKSSKKDWLDMGDLLAPIGSPDWCKAAREQAKSAIDDVGRVREEVVSWVEGLRIEGRYKKLTDKSGNRFSSWWHFCSTPRPYGLGQTPEEISDLIAQRPTATDMARMAKHLNGHGGDRKKCQADNVSLKVFGNGADYLTARIARDRPDILERMKAGEFRSVRAAALEAGIVKEKTVTEKIRSLWTKLSDSEKRQLVKWISEQD